MTPLEYCRAKGAPPASSDYYAVLFADRDRQPALLAVLALQAELLETGRIGERSVAATKLNWWRDEIDRAFNGAGRHPVSQALAEPLQRFELPRENFEQLLEGAAMDLEYGSYPSFSQLSVYCHNTGTALTQLLATINGYRDRGTLRYAHHLGMGLRLARLLRDVRRDTRNGHFYLPEDEMQAAGVDQSALLEPQSSAAVQALFAQQAERIEDFFEQACGQLPALDRWAQRSGLALIELHRALIAEMRADGFPLLEREYHLTPIRKLWLAWRTTRRQKSYKRARP